MSKNPTPFQDPFIQSVEQALEHFADPTWLGTHSPLAAPYVLGKRLDGYAESQTPLGRGRALCDRLLASAHALSSDQQHLLRLSFFQRDLHLNNSGLALKLGYSQATYYRYRTNAIEALAQEFSQQLLPPLRPEMPPKSAMVGRADLLENCTQALRDLQSVALLGPSGIGKTTLGRAIVEEWGNQHCFWFTIRPGFNDQLSSLVFALGYFLHGLGVAYTWRQLVADRGVLHIERSLGLLRYDLSMLTDVLPLICIDEVDQLHHERNEHSQILYLLEDLRGRVPLLLIGQQLAVETQQIYSLTSFSQAELAQVLQQHPEGEPTKMPPALLSAAEQQQLLQATRGNPALVSLLVRLWQTGETLADLLAWLGNAPSLELLLTRLWKRLDQEEQSLLLALAVFRSFAPQDGWTAYQAAMQRLIERRLIEQNGEGEIAIVSYLRLLIRQRIPAEQRLSCHQAAAHMLASRGNYTEAVYHYLEARQPAWAVWLWFHHRTQEIEGGRAGAALAIFQNLALSDLENEEDRRALSLLRAELLKLVGRHEEAEAALQANRWPVTHPATPFVQQLQGDLLELQEGRMQQALEAYRLGLQQLGEAAQQRSVELITRRGYIYLYRLRDLKQARQEALLARLKAEDFFGNVEEESGNYGLARTHYNAALAIATQLENNLQFLARIHSNLGRLTWRQGDAATAILHLEQAIRHAERRGHALGILNDRVNLSGAYIVAGNYRQALEQAQAGLKLAEELRHAYLIAGLATNACEACYYLKRFDESERYAMQSLQQEEEAHRPYSLTILGLIYHARQQTEQAERTLHNAIRSAQEIQDKYAEAAAWRALGRCYLERPSDPISQATTHHALQEAIRLYTELDLVQDAAAIKSILQARLSTHPDRQHSEPQA